MAGKGAGSLLCGRLIGVWLVALHGVLCSGVVEHRLGLAVRLTQFWSWARLTLNSRRCM